MTIVLLDPKIIIELWYKALKNNKTTVGPEQNDMGPFTRTKKCRLRST